MNVKSYKDLTVWQKAFELSLKTYKTTNSFPKEELYGITSQIRRAAIAIPSNIAEGCARQGTKEYIHFLNIAYASAAELETQILIAKEIGILSFEDFNKINMLLIEIMKMLKTLMLRLKARH